MNDKSNKPSWDEAPARAMWLAQEPDTDWYWSEKRPLAALSDEQSHGWLSGGGWSAIAAEGNGNPQPNWRDTLERRPEPEPDDEDDDNPSGFKLAPPPPILWAKPCQDCARSPGMVKAITEGDEADVHWCVECHSCKRRGKWAHTETEAVDRWNETTGEPSEEAWAAGWNWQPGESDDADTIEFEAEAQWGIEWGNINCGDHGRTYHYVEIPLDTNTGTRYRVTLTPVVEEPKLKPCPFCGGEANLDRAPIHAGGPRLPLCQVLCSRCEVAATPWGSLGDVVTAWNRRAQ